MDLPDPHWRGWRVAGRCLVTPHRDRVSVDVLEHLVHMHAIRCHFERVGLAAQAAAARSRSVAREKRLVRVVVVDLAAWRAAHGLGAS